MLDFSWNYFCIPNKMNVGLFQYFPLYFFREMLTSAPGALVKECPKELTFYRFPKECPKGTSLKKPYF